jgi:tRNA(Ile)-lysidine synthase
MILEKIKVTAFQKCGIDKERPIVIGVSGGADSLCLVYALSSLGFSLVIAHFNHQLRPEAGEDSQFVKGVAEKLNLPFISGSGPVKDYADQNGLSIEQAARDLRYRFLFEQARRYSAQAVAVGHTADDQVETVLMHLVRGCGLAGLKGMPFHTNQHGWSQEFPLVRPLLTIWHADTLSYCSQIGINPIYDLSNSDMTFLRNRIRHELIPLLEDYNPGFRKGILRTVQIISSDYETLESEFHLNWEHCILNEGIDHINLDRGRIRELNLSNQRGVVRKSIAKIRPSLFDVALDTVERALDFINGTGNSGRIDLVDGMQLIREGNQVHILKERTTVLPNSLPQLIPGVSLILDVPGTVELSDGMRIHGNIIFEEDIDKVKAAAFTNEDPFQAWVDLDSLNLPLEVRTRRPGETWQPLGMNGASQKVKDFMINVKCPVYGRDQWPLVCSGDQIVWIAGYRMAHFARITMSSKRILHLRLSKFNLE